MVTGLSFKELQKSGLLMPQEEMLEVGKKHARLHIGIPKETSFQENRVPLTPNSVALLTSCGHDVVIETDAGKNSNFQDKDYSDAGARIAYNREEVYQAEIIVKVSQPTEAEIELFKPKQILFSAVQVSNQYEAVIRALAAKRVTAFAYNYMKDGAGVFPVIRSMGEIAGSTSVLIAAEYLSNVNEGIGLMLGGVTGIPPIEMVIIGAGVVGENAARVALGLGVEVKVFDNSLSRLSRLKANLNNYQIFTSLIQQDILSRRLQTADVVIGALRAPEGRTPCVVSEQMVSDMKYGSVIVDVSIDQGGCFETSKVTSHTQPVFKKYGVTHYCVPNIPSRVSHTASMALSNIFTPIFVSIGDEGGIERYLMNHPYIRSGVYVFNGSVTNKFFADMYQMPFMDIDLVMSAL